MCNFCPQEERHDHLFFECEETKGIWKDVLTWIQIDHDPKSWQEEVPWLVREIKRKGKRAITIRLAIAETIYGIWWHRNETCFDERQNIEIL